MKTVEDKGTLVHYSSDETEELNAITYSLYDKNEKVFIVYCSGDNEVAEFKSIDSAKKERDKLIEKYSGSGIFPRIIIALAASETEVF